MNTTKKKISLMIENVHILTIDSKNTEYENGFIAIDEGKIIALGDIDEKGVYIPEKMLDGRGKYAMPGLVNTHTHAAMVLFRGYANDLPLWEWLTKKIWPLEARLEERHIYYLSKLAMAEMIESGTTTFSDMYMFMEETARAVEKVGMRAVLARGLQGPDEDSDSRLRENKELWERWHGGAGGKIEVMLGPHAIYTCSKKYLLKCIELAKELGIGMHMHISETQKEVEDSLAEHGKTPVAYLDELGLFELPTLAAHCVHLTDEEIDILAKRGVSVSHCPYSNLKLASGFMKTSKLVEGGVNVSIGTDGASSNNNLSMIKEMQLAAVLAKGVAEDASVLPAPALLKMTTINGAKALGLENRIGSIEVGKRADIILIERDRPHLKPTNDASSLIAYSSHSADVDSVIVDGNILMEKRELKTIDLDRVYFESEKIKRELMG